MRVFFYSSPVEVVAQEPALCCIWLETLLIQAPGLFYRAPDFLCFLRRFVLFAAVY